MNRCLRWTLAVVFVSFGSAWSRGAGEDPLMKPWTLDEAKQVLEKCGEFKPFPQYGDREFWEKIKTDKRFGPSLTAAVDRAREYAKQDFPYLPASLYLDFQRTGNRVSCERVLGQRSGFLSAFALAECLEGKGEFLDPLMNALWAFCEESDWCMPAHTDGLIDMENPNIDLRASNTANVLANIDYVFGDALPERLRMRLNYELERRIFGPYQKREFSWMKRTHNWNAVCNGNVLSAALYKISDKNRLAELVAKAQNSLCLYLTGFGRDGGTAEGLGYWNYGFGNYVEAAQMLNRYTDKRLNMLAAPIVKEIALLPMRVELSPGKYPSFSDGGENNRFSTSMLCYLADELNAPELRRFAAARMEYEIDAGSLLSLFENTQFAPLPGKKEEFVPAPYVFLRGVEWMIVRDDNGLVLAAKGGRNDEPHNHNDVGNIILHYQGETLIPDLGAPVYDRRFFSNKRYEYLAARSLGHSLPLVNGFEQRPGPFAAITKTERKDDGAVLRVDMTAAYPQEAGLKSLVRTTTFKNKIGIDLLDEAQFESAPKSFETAIWTYAPVEVTKSGVKISVEKAILEVSFGDQKLSVDVKEYDMKENNMRNASRHPIARRIAFRLDRPEKEARIHLTISIKKL
ncbi:MAG: heparinase II/III family protein [Candidatus Omnitrophota bacterium]